MGLINKFCWPAILPVLISNIRLEYQISEISACVLASVDQYQVSDMPFCVTCSPYIIILPYHSTLYVLCSLTANFLTNWFHGTKFLLRSWLSPSYSRSCLSCREPEISYPCSHKPTVPFCPYLTEANPDPHSLCAEDCCWHCLPIFVYTTQVLFSLQVFQLTDHAHFSSDACYMSCPCSVIRQF